MSSYNPIFTPPDHPEVQKFHREGKTVMDLRDDGKWHQLSPSGAGKGDRPRPVNSERYRRNFDRIFHSMGVCPDCGTKTRPQSGCEVCPQCGWSACG